MRKPRIQRVPSKGNIVICACGKVFLVRYTGHLYCSTDCPELKNWPGIRASKTQRIVWKSV